MNHPNSGIPEEIWTLPSFLSVRECEDLIRFSELPGFEEATVGLATGPKMLKGIRNNSRLEYDDQNLADRLWQKLKSHCPDTIDNTKVVGLNEHFRFYKYINNRRFKRHRDGRFKRNEQE